VSVPDMRARRLEDDPVRERHSVPQIAFVPWEGSPRGRLDISRIGVRMKHS
jgi:hypothetical protein